MNYKLLVVSIASIGITACQSTPPVKKTDPAIELIKKDTKKIKESLEVLSKLQQADSNRIGLYSYKKPTKGPLTKKISMPWTGDAEKALRKIAKNIGFLFEVTGKKPIDLNHVLISSEYRMAVDTIEDIGWQAGKRMGVLTNNNKKIIKVIYANQENDRTL